MCSVAWCIDRQAANKRTKGAQSSWWDLGMMALRSMVLSLRFFSEALDAYHDRRHPQLRSLLQVTDCFCCWTWLPFHQKLQHALVVDVWRGGDCKKAWLALGVHFGLCKGERPELQTTDILKRSGDRLQKSLACPLASTLACLKVSALMCRQPDTLERTGDKPEGVACFEFPYTSISKNFAVHQLWPFLASLLKNSSQTFTQRHLLG